MNRLRIASWVVGMGLLCQWTTAPAWGGSLEDGLAAYQAQDYSTAKAFWERTAKQSGVKGYWAHYYLGILYQHGLGVEWDVAKAKSHYQPIYERMIGFLSDSEEEKAFNAQLPVDGLHRWAMIEFERAKAMDASDVKSERDRAPEVFQSVRIALDVAGFYRHAQSFYNRAIMTEAGTGRRFVKNEEHAWALYTLAAELGHPTAAREAQRLANDFSDQKQKEADQQLASYRRFIRPPE